MAYGKRVKYARRRAARRGIRRIGRRTGRRTTGGRSVSKGLSAMGGKGRKVLPSAVTCLVEHLLMLKVLMTLCLV